MVTFSIITAFFKGNQYVPELVSMALENAKELKKHIPESHLELILVNDSPDVTVELPEIPSGLSVRVINHEKNGGIHQARVTGLLASKGDFIVFLDQDDEIEPDCLLKEYHTIRKYHADVAVGNAWLEQSDGSMIKLYKSKGDFMKVIEIGPYIKSHNQIVSPGHCLIRKEAIPAEWCENIMSVNGSDDLFLWILMLSLKKSFKICNDIVYTHVYTGNNLSAEEEKMAVSSLETAEYLKKISYVSEKDISDFIRNRKLKIEFAHAGKLKKIILILKNTDIFAARVFWKIRGKLL